MCTLDELHLNWLIDFEPIRFHQELEMDGLVDQLMCDQLRVEGGNMEHYLRRTWLHEGEMDGVFFGPSPLAIFRLAIAALS
ncbi:MAG: hypothetical protein HOI95_28190 [Chromatiales bacterium]|nr:hypothetical protein [Chromatiales bacterium]